MTPEYLAKPLTPCPLPTKDGWMLRAIGDAGEYILALRRSAGGLLIGNRSVGVLDDFIAVSVPHVDTMGEMFAILHRPQSSSASRFTAGAAGSLLLSLEAAKAWRNLASAGKEAAIVDWCKAHPTTDRRSVLKKRPGASLFPSCRGNRHPD